MRTPFIAGNWKMNLCTENTEFPEEAYIQTLIKNVTDAIEVCVFPPFTHVGLLSAIADGVINIGGQNLHQSDSGAHTGDVSAECLLDVGATYVLTGHSERRTNHGETDEDVCAKTETALIAGLNAVICIGESDEDNRSGKTMDVLVAQLSASVPLTATAETVVIAYEPVWAIGTGRIPTVSQIESIHAGIRTHLAKQFDVKFSDNVRIIYGGSVKPSNANEILKLQNVDGALVGGASLKSNDFIGVIKGLDI